MRVLVVDNSSAILDVVGEALRTQGLEVVTASTTVAARAVMDAADRPPLAIFDYDLGTRENGIDLADQATSKGMRAAVMSGSVVGISRLAEVPYPTLRKPFRFADLFAVMETLAATTEVSRHPSARHRRDRA